MTKEIILTEAMSYMDENDCNATEFANLCGVHPSQMQYYRRGKRKLNDKDAVLIARFLNIPYKSEEKTKTRIKSIPSSDAVGIRGDAMALVKIYREVRGFATDTDAATELVKIGFKTLISKEANA